MAEALRLVTHDLGTGGLPAPTITWVENWMTVAFADGATHGTLLHSGSSAAEVLQRVADLVHEWGVEESWSLGLGTNWPPCPDHPDSHALWVTRLGDDVAWVCPRDGRTRIPVGSLPAT